MASDRVYIDVMGSKYSAKGGNCGIEGQPDYSVAGSSSETLNACEEVVRPDGFRHTSVKQEISSNNDERSMGN
ncbi:MAG: hypothetical protein ACE5OZ_11390 [Candidatus Heimdallarchaeota archaeon]